MAQNGLAWIEENEPAAKQKVNGFSAIEEYMKILAENGTMIGACSTCSNNSCANEKAEKENCSELPVIGLTELAVKSCNEGIPTVVF